MGTRADFYVGTGPSSEWLGSITWDGYPDGWPKKAIGSKTEEEFRASVEELLADDECTSTRPSDGWPWPWEDSRTTDYAYAWCSDGCVRLSSFGRRWETPSEHKERSDEDEIAKLGDDEVVDMSARKAGIETIMAKSGLIVVRVPRG